LSYGIQSVSYSFGNIFLKDKVSVFLFQISKSKICQSNDLNDPIRNNICRNCFLTSLECRRRRHARFRAARIAVIGVLSSWVTVSEIHPFECPYLLIPDWHFLTVLIFF
jgi:hypothetical protein